MSGSGDSSNQNLGGRVDATQLSQEDCIVWNEGSDVDLRRLASSSFETPGALRENPFGSAPSNSSSSGEAIRTTRKLRPSLSEVTRIIAAQDASLNDDTSEVVSRKRRRRRLALQTMALAEEVVEQGTAANSPPNATEAAINESPPSAHARCNEFADLLQQIKTPPNHAELAAAATLAAATKTPQRVDSKRKSRRYSTDDEFDELNLSMDEIAALDALVEQATQKENKPNQQYAVVNGGNKPKVASPNRRRVPATETSEENDDDEFGDFPDDIDFSALDQSVSEHMSQKTAVSQAPAVDGCMSHSRYKVLAIHRNASVFQMTLTVAAWQTEMLEEVALAKSIHKADDFARRYPASQERVWAASGEIHLLGEWYHTPLEPGDIIHICSLSGKSPTGPESLPLTLQTISQPGYPDDDLLLIVHPDMLLTPTTITEAISCSRRAVLKSRLGSTGLTSKAPLLGTMRHQLFEASMKEKNFSLDFARPHISRIVRENAEGLLACDISPYEAERELIKFFPQLQSFASAYTTFFDGGSSANTKQFPILESCGISAPIRCRVDEVTAIEEPIVSPELGLKGNIDMIVKASTGSPESTSLTPSAAAMCVELKTGHGQRTQHAHTAQLALYMIMLRSRYVADYSDTSRPEDPRDESMLLYMNDEAVRAVCCHPSLPEIKSLVGHRNLVAIETLRAARPRGVVLSYHPGADDASKQDPSIDLLEHSPAVLPELPTNAHICQKCYLNRECMLYAAAGAVAGAHERHNTHKDLLDIHTGHLQPEDLAYFQKFDRLIDLEADAENALITQAWLTCSSDRQDGISKCISNLQYDSDGSRGASSESASVSISFRQKSVASQNVPLSELGLEPGALVIVSYDATTIDNENVDTPRRRPMHLVRGAIERVTTSHVLVRASAEDLMRIEKLTSSYAADIPFRLDKDDVATGISTLRQNIVNFFTADKNPQFVGGSRLQRLRDLIVRLRKPTFDGSVLRNLFTPPPGAPTIPGCDCKDLIAEYAQMNPDQQAAVASAFTANDFSLIQGFPGAGKTSTITFIVRLLVAHGKRVMVTSYTNAAVDNVVLKLIEKGVSTTNSSQPLPALVRISRSIDCHSGVVPVMTSTIAKELEKDVSIFDDEETTITMPSAAFLKRAVDSAKIVAVTALTAPRSSQLCGQHFDVVIVDEAGQISQPAAIGALIMADTFVLVGDHMQLPPLVNSELAERGGYGISMLKLLAEAHPDTVAKLSYQYRMNADICQLSNDLVYNGALKCGNDAVRDQILELQSFPENVAHDWLRQALDPTMPVVFVNTDLRNGQDFKPLEHMQAGKILNEKEARLVTSIITSLLACGVRPDSVGVICPFRAQLQQLHKCEFLASAKDRGLEISTIDRYQGRDKDVIVLSFVRSNEKRKVGRLLEDFRRLNVAITRAKCKLIMVGSFSTIFHGSRVMKPALCRLKNRNRVLSAATTP